MQGLLKHFCKHSKQKENSNLSPTKINFKNHNKHQSPTTVPKTYYGFSNAIECQCASVHNKQYNYEYSRSSPQELLLWELLQKFYQCNFCSKLELK